MWSNTRCTGSKAVQTAKRGGAGDGNTMENRRLWQWRTGILSSIHHIPMHQMWFWRIIRTRRIRMVLRRPNTMEILSNVWEWRKIATCTKAQRSERRMSAHDKQDPALITAVWCPLNCHIAQIGEGLQIARPTVPHCKDCKHYRDVRSHGDERGSHRCLYYGASYEKRKVISGQEIRTCPKWCPLRNCGMRVAW